MPHPIHFTYPRFYKLFPLLVQRGLALCITRLSVSVTLAYVNTVHLPVQCLVFEELISRKFKFLGIRRNRVSAVDTYQ
jgi:hypothetical protein